MAGRPDSSTPTRRRGLASLAGLVFLLLLLVAVGTSTAAKLRGTPKGERIVGTKGADSITGKSGNDKIKGRAGKDKLSGGKGRDLVVGGGGKDKMAGGAGKDTIKAADGRRDKAINGGPGKNKCVIDTALELSIARNCGSIKGIPGGGGPAPGPAGGLRLLDGRGVACDTPLPICAFTLSGDGADGLVGTVTGGGGVTAVGGSVTPSGSEWSAAGLYGCTADGHLRVEIGSESIDVPVDCTA